MANQYENDRDKNWGSYASGMSYGFLYILTNQSMPGLVKVGQTERHPSARVLELSQHSGVPTPFSVRFYIEVNDRFKAEQVVHRALDSCRVSADREFFRASPTEVEQLILKVAAEFILPFSARTPRNTDISDRPVCTKCGYKLIPDAYNKYFNCTNCGAITPIGVSDKKSMRLL